MTDVITKTPAEELEDETQEAWVRSTDEPEIRDVYASFDGEWWQVVVPVAEFLREDPLESRLIDGVTAALQEVADVDVVEQEDREVWLVSGSPSGEALVGAAADIIDELAPAARSYLDELD
jgi:hypothetical protein